MTGGVLENENPQIITSLKRTMKWEMRRPAQSEVNFLLSTSYYWEWNNNVRTEKIWFKQKINKR